MASNKQDHPATQAVLNFIGGEFVPSVTGRTLSSGNPRQKGGEGGSQLPDSDHRDVDTAVKGAAAAQPSWWSLGVERRSAILERVADLIEERSEALSRAESLDQGKPLWLAKQMDVPRAATNFRHFARTALRDAEEADQSFFRDGVLEYCTRLPLGVVALVTPWNLPLYLLTFKMAPALAYGNAVVAKPSEFTPVTAHILAHILKEAGVPPGVVNVVHGLGRSAGSALTSHPLVDGVSFTGSTATGGMVAASAGHKKVSLEMGGKNAALVFDDADLDLTVEVLARSSFVNSGQVCLATSRIFIHSKVYEEFVRKFIQKAKSLSVGPGDEDRIGPLVSHQHWTKVCSYLDLAKEEGATFLCGEDQSQAPQGNFVSPVVLEGLTDSSRCMQEEIFGPVTCISVFETEVEVIRRAEDVPYGLCACVFTKDLARAHRVSNKLEVGTVWVNCWLVRNLHLPFGGFKSSGLGREGTRESRDFCTQQRSVCIRFDQPSIL